MESLHGHLLIATPSLADPNFFRTVVLVGEHGEDGAMGLVLNRPAPATVAEAVPDLVSLPGDEEHLFLGGPVRPTVVLVLAEFIDPSDAGMLITDRVGFLSADSDLDVLAQSAVRARVFAGHAGWGAGQLESEIERADWIVKTAQDRDVFDDEPGAMWGHVLERMGGRFALLARIPTDPSVN